MVLERQSPRAAGADVKSQMLGPLLALIHISAGRRRGMSISALEKASLVFLCVYL